tara:strand:+ start:1568 stop:3313 length:1746 start_codon:yes stop_codon:yes gene_type:complete
MSHRDNFIKTNKEFSEPLDIFNIGFMGALGAPPDVPSAPTVSNSDGTITISWSAPDAHGNAIDVYNVYRNGTYLKQVSTTSTTDTTGTLGTSYTYAIDAHNVIDWSGVSPNSSSVIPAQVPSIPTAPTASRSTSTVTVSWSAPSSNGASITNYQLYRNSAVLVSSLGNVLTYTDSTGTLGTSYNYQIKALNSQGWSTASGFSNSVTPSTVPNAPTIGTAVDNGNGTITANWSPATANGNAVTNYKVYANGSEVATVGNVTSYVHTITLGNSYYYSVSATNANGYGSTSGNSNTVVTVAPLTGVIGVYMGGTQSGTNNTMDYITITSTGNATDFGDLSFAQSNGAGVHSSTRGISAGGNGYTDAIQYITIVNRGTSTDFGDLTVARANPAGYESSTRGVISGGGFGFSDVIDYVTIATTGDATDFGNLTVARYACSGVSSSTRGVTCGGYGPSGFAENNICDYVTIASTGNATDFGDLTQARRFMASVNSSTRGVLCSGYNLGAKNYIDYITIATTGNATTFGNGQTRYRQSGVSSTTRGVVAGGESSITSMQYITIASTGNSTNFGNLTVGRDDMSGVSNV